MMSGGRPVPHEIDQVLVSPLVGGAGLIAIGLADEVRKRGRISRAWVPASGAASEAIAARGIRWHRYSLDMLQRGGAAQVAAFWPFARRLLVSRGCVVHVHNPTVYGLLSPVLRLVGARSVVQFHIDPTRDEILWTLRHSPSAVITCSRHIGALVASVSAEAGRPLTVVPIPNSIDIDRYAPGDRAAARRQVGAPPDRPLMVMLANLSEHKGQLTAIRAVGELRRRGVDVECWLAGEERGGEGPFSASLRALARELGVAERVRFLGFRTDGPDLLRAADFFLLPSTHEGLPLSVLEAQSTGAVVLGAPIPGIREVVTDGETGFLIHPDDAAGYAARIATLVEDAALRSRVVETARALVRREHSWTQYVEQTWRVYESVA